MKVELLEQEGQARARVPAEAKESTRHVTFLPMTGDRFFNSKPIWY
jgi:hypothetical protein